MTPRQPQPGQANRQVHGEDAAPAKRLDQASSQYRTERDSKRARAGPGRDRLRPAFRFGDRMVEQRK